MVLKSCIALAVVITAPLAAQEGKGVNGKHACALLSQEDIKQITGRPDVARSPGQKEEPNPYTSNCLFNGAIDITIHIGTQTKVMFGRERDNYDKAPARLGYKVDPITGLGDVAYYLSDKSKVEVRTIVGEMELVVSLSGSLPPEADVKKMGLGLAKAALAKLK